MSSPNPEIPKHLSPSAEINWRFITRTKPANLNKETLVISIQAAGKYVDELWGMYQREEVNWDFVENSIRHLIWENEDVGVLVGNLLRMKKATQEYEKQEQTS